MDKVIITLFALFAGYQSQMMALIEAARVFAKLLGVELIGWSEIDPIVQVSHNLAFPEYKDRCYPDVTKIDWQGVKDFDILMYSSP